MKQLTNKKLAQYESLRNTVSDLRRVMSEIDDYLLEHEAPFKVGEVWACNNRIHKGSEFLVDRVICNSIRIDGDDYVVTYLARGKITERFKASGMQAGRTEGRRYPIEPEEMSDEVKGALEEMNECYTREEMLECGDFETFFDLLDTQNTYEEDWNAEKFKPYYKEAWEILCIH